MDVLAFTAALHRPTPLVPVRAIAACSVVVAGATARGVAVCRTVTATCPTAAAGQTPSAFALPYFYSIDVLIVNITARAKPSFLLGGAFQNS